MNTEHTQSNAVDTDPIVAYSCKDFLQMDIPEREFLLTPLIPKRSLSMIHAPRGLGKTHLALGIACAIAGGEKFLKWTAPKASRVVYLDGEMPATEMRRRIETHKMSREQRLTNLSIVSQEFQSSGMPDLSTKNGQERYSRVLEDADFLVIDNLSCLLRSGDENSAEDQHSFTEFLLKLRRIGTSVLLVHHSGKTGQQRGTSRREDLLDVVLGLRPSLAGSSKGASFEVYFEKHRHLYGADIEPFTAMLSADGKWSMSTTESLARHKYREGYLQGMSDAEIAKKFDKHRSSVGRTINRMVIDGTVAPRADDTKRQKLVCQRSDQ